METMDYVLLYSAVMSTIALVMTMIRSMNDD